MTRKYQEFQKILSRFDTPRQRRSARLGGKTDLTHVAIEATAFQTGRRRKALANQSFDPANRRHDSTLMSVTQMSRIADGATVRIHPALRAGRQMV